KAKAPRKKATRPSKSSAPTAAAETPAEATPTAVTPGEISTPQAATPKKPQRPRKAAGTTPRAPRSRKKPSLVTRPAEAVETHEINAVVEQAETTAPEQPREAVKAESREALFSDLALDEPLTETEPETPPELEETHKRHSVHLPPLLEARTTSPLPATNGHNTVQEAADIVETPPTPRIDTDSVPDTPWPLAGDEDEQFVQDTLFIDAASMEMEQHNGAIAAPTMPATPLPDEIDELLMLALAEVVDRDLAIIEPGEEAAPVVAPQRPQPPRAKPVKARVALVLLALLALSIAALWRDVSLPHLYLYNINPLDGQANALQDLGAGYTNTTLLTNPVLLRSSLLVGLPGSQRILSLNGGGQAGGLAQQINVPLTTRSQASLSIAPNQDLVVASPGGIQVLRPDGSRLWQTSAEGPSQGAHAFAPAIDTTTLYTVIAANGGEIAAYNLTSGTPRWIQKLPDSFDFAPPMLVSADTLYVAGDHTLYALDSANGGPRWHVALPARTLLLDQQGARPLLIAAGASGLTALDAQSGVVAWSFSGYAGAPGSATGAGLTNAQLYQAAYSTTNQMVYTTGIVWDEQQAREQLWLFAVDASTGAPRWSEQVGSDVASADAGRVLTPFFDAAQGLALLEVAQGDGSHTLSAYDTGSGSLRWSIRLTGVSAFAPTLFQTNNDTVSLLAVQSDIGTALRSRSWLHLALLALGIVCLLLLLGLWFIPLSSWRLRTSTGLKRLSALSQLPGRTQQRKTRRLLFTGLLVALIAGPGSLTFLSINRPQRYLNAVGASSGSTQWQHSLDTPGALSGADGQESFVVLHPSSALSALSALNSDGSLRWSTPASEGTYSLPSAQTAPGTLLVALSGPTAPHYLDAPGDTGYPQLETHLFSLSLLSSATGRVLWQTTVVRGDEAQDTVVLGADAQYTYIASRAIAIPGQAAVAQLIAVDTASGAIAWRVFGPREDGTVPPDFGALLPHGRLLYWQVASTIYALDTQLGQIQWRTPLAEVNATSALIEEPQMTLTAGVLLIRRSDQYHALALSSGVQLWSINGLGSPTQQAPGGMLVAANGTLILYGSNTIEALDAASRAILWQHTNLANITGAVAAPDGSLVYAIVLDDLNNTSPTPHQALIAFDVTDSSVRWTFQPSTLALFLYPGAPALRLAHGMLYVTLCMAPASPPSSGDSSCNAQVLYGLNGATGAVSWQFGADQVTSVQVSQDGSAIIFQTSSSLWENFKARFLGE
ncbi:MAG TPA: PQQ-binding-like beta-propeller repeat protein, partial [Ktedonobacteraceae bacterium]|nr:PQQ-binding-like beta-propeller repeat protein [Ktedonobacteraceae bacterium]